MFSFFFPTPLSYSASLNVMDLTPKLKQNKTKLRNKTNMQKISLLSFIDTVLGLGLSYLSHRLLKYFPFLSPSYIVPFSFPISSVARIIYLEYKS